MEISVSFSSSWYHFLFRNALHAYVLVKANFFRKLGSKDSFQFVKISQLVSQTNFSNASTRKLNNEGIRDLCICSFI